MKKLLILLFIPLFMQSIYSQQGKGLSNAVDAAGYCYVSGYAPNLESGNDMLILKYDTNGDTLWTKTIPAQDPAADSRAVGIKTTIDGSVYAVGNIGVPDSSTNVVILKFSSDGELLWSRPCGTINSNLEDKAFGIAVDETDNVYITGFSGLEGSQNIFTVKYDGDGNVQWTSFCDQHNLISSQGTAITLNHNGKVCVTGFGVSESGNSDIITLKYNSSNGSEMWYGIYNGTGNSEDKAFGIAVDESDNLYVTGYATDTATGIDMALLKYSANGTWQWTSTFDGGSALEDKAFGLVIDGNSAYITGYSSTELAKNYNTLKYDLVNGDKLWNTVYQGPAGDDQANSIGLIKDNGVTVGIVVTGASIGTDNSEDFATVSYTPDDGTAVDSSRYSSSTGSNDIALQLSVTDDGTVYVTGGSELIINARQVAKVKTLALKWGKHTKHVVNSNVPVKYNLYQNYPNPFNPSTNIKFDLAKSSVVKLTIYDMLGREVAVPINGMMQSGTHEIRYTNSNLSSGAYFYELKTDDFRDVKKMILIK